MSIQGVLRRGRRAAEARMTSRCDVRRKTDETTTDDDGFEVPVWATIYTDLPFRLSGVIRGQSQSRRTQAAGVEFETAMRTGNFPAGTTDLLDGDLVDITDGDNAGRVIRIVEASWQDQATARRVPVVEAQRPEEWS